jgi:hypothetical protein
VGALDPQGNDAAREAAALRGVLATGPSFAVTGKDGVLVLRLPPGAYRARAVKGGGGYRPSSEERAGRAETKAEVREGESATAKVVLE